ncbi:protein-methionine-sulfoxide reductase heme-binding subunit MsrQ [Thalassotalea agarivorans]|uniref:Protein-methionine-sulfoxide reductase heme-binding subunit MsrQ n=1 Tax=Thalassotalea agarivorans TaxID=349064 RepID=A0A1H9ZHB7_THASX|nr:protein-methionine-sulfoxide reductase heme-binding subunit MsrQ [Thalassotalea agarivorans]SES80942.1 sulfoxide reductase heme-binding subunit YedZ [Thalassotalea agarivorans]
MGAQSKHKIWMLKAAIHVICLGCIGWLYTAAAFDKLGADPVEYVIHYTGMGALHCLLLTLLVTPLAKGFKQAWLMQTRRLIGLYSFTFACLHILNFYFFELGQELSLFLSELIERPYITMGLGGFIILFLLAVTSPNIIKRRMKKRWQHLHNWVYLAAILIGVHFYWSVKSEIIEPTIYLLIIVVLLAFRRKKLLSFKRTKTSL